MAKDRRLPHKKMIVDPKTKNFLLSFSRDHIPGPVIQRPQLLINLDAFKNSKGKSVPTNIPLKLHCSL
jgi:hypothetical protein